MYDCLDILVDFFSSGNQGLETDFLQSVEKFRQLKKYLNYSRMDTQKLIITYYQEMVDYQNSQRYCDNGKLICRACFHSKDEILAIESKLLNFFSNFTTIIFNKSFKMQKFTANGSKRSQ